MAIREQPAARFFLEAVVIVGSILLAFGIDAWWDGLQARGEELQLLAVLERDLLENQEELVRVRGILDDALTAGDAFSAATPVQLSQLPLDSARTLLYGLGSAAAFTAFKGNLDRADLSVLSSADLRAELASWVSHADDLAENGTRDMEAVRGLALEADAGTLPLLGSAPGSRADAEALAVLRADAEFLALLEWKQALQRISVREALALEDVTIQVLGNIRLEIRENR